MWLEWFPFRTKILYDLCSPYPSVPVLLDPMVFCISYSSTLSVVRGENREEPEDRRTPSPYLLPGGRAVTAWLSSYRDVDQVTSHSKALPVAPESLWLVRGEWSAVSQLKLSWRVSF